MGYGRFAAMIATSTVVMFGLMYLNTYLLAHVFWSETRAYMAIVMGAAMAVIMLAFMLSMYANGAINAAIFIGAIVVFAGALWLVRSQVTVGDSSYMRAMIPHHSIAIMTSSHANISDPRVRKLADEIVYAQNKEIAEMRYLIGDIGASADAPAQDRGGSAGIGTLTDALSTAEVGSLDPQFMNPEDVAQVAPGGGACTFAYTQTSPPVLAIAEDGAALVKLSDDLVRLEAADAAARASGPTLAADGITMRIGAPGDAAFFDATAAPQEAVLELAAGLRVGYRGFYRCGA